MVRKVERDERDLLGEGPVWVAERNRLFWVDIVGQAARWLDLRSGATGSHAFAEPIGWILPRQGRRDFVVGLKSGFAVFDIDSGALAPIGDPEPHLPDNRLNDAKVDRAGRIWAGSKDDRDQDASGALFRLDPGFGWSRHDGGYQVTNGPTFSLDGRTLFHTDSGARTVFAFDLADDGSLSRKRPWVVFPEDWGHPDGMTTDAQGCVWIAHWGGGRISRFDPNGRHMRSIALPASNITSMAFAGPSLNRLFVTSSMMDHPDEPEAGSLFEVEAGVAGLPMPAFAG